MRRLPALYLVALALVGCAHRPPAVTVADCTAARTEARRLHDTWQDHRLTGTAQITARDGLLRSRANATLAVVPPDRLRLEMSDDFGQTLLLALVNDAGVAFWTPSDGWLTGPPAAAALPVPATVWRHLPRLLLGLPCHDPSCAPLARADWPIVLLTCDGEPIRWRWHAADRRLVGADLSPLRVSYLDSEPVNGLHPPDLDVAVGEGRSLSLHWQQYHLDRDLPLDLFRPPRPETAPTSAPPVERP